jgi:hypothetical protein
VFHRDTVADQVTVTRKALAYAEVIITSSCRNAASRTTRGERRGNDVKAHLDTLSRRSVLQLQKDTLEALESLEDTRRSMAVYRDGPDLQDRIRNSCFTSTGFRLQMKASHTVIDLNVRLHERLLIFNQHSIPIGFYYAKWLEKLNYYIGQLSKEGSRNPSPSAQSASALQFQRRKIIPPLRLHLLRRQTLSRMNQCGHSWRRELQSSTTERTIS